MDTPTTSLPPAGQAFRFRDWDVHFENNKSRPIGALTYFLQPNKLEGEALGAMLMEPDGLELYGTLGFLKIVASKSAKAERGWLVRNGTALNARRIACLARIPADKIPQIERSLAFFSTSPMDWLEPFPYPTSNNHQPQLNEHLPDTATAPQGHLLDTAAAGQRQGSGRAPQGHPKGTISPLTDLLTDKRTEVQRERERTGGFATKGEARLAQRTQWAACNDRKKELEAIPEDERTEKQARDLERVRGLQKKIRRKQQRGDFTPVEEEAAK